MSIFEEIESIHRNYSTAMYIHRKVFGLGPVTYSFTNAGSIGVDGPSQSAIDAGYAGSTLDGLVTINANGLQQWTVPVTSIYQFTVVGAVGGLGRYNDSTDIGNGTQMHGELLLIAGTILYICVGQKGGDYTDINTNASGGGGGMSLVTIQGDDTLPLIVAGGGGGSAYYDNVEAAHATTSNDGKDRRYSKFWRLGKFKG